MINYKIFNFYFVINEKHFAKKANDKLSGPPETATANFLYLVRLENSL